MSEQLNRFAFASPSAMLLARFLDLYEASKLTELINELSQSLYGGRLTLQYTPELSLVSRTLYYSCSLLKFGFTPGQALCDLTLVRSTTNSSGGSKGGTVAKVQRSNILWVIALYSIIPYIFERRSTIIAGLSSVYDVVLAPEAGIANPPRSAQADAISEPNSSEEEDQTDVEPTDTEYNPKKAMESFLTKFVHALTAAVASIASSCSERVEAAVNFLMDVHRFLFFLHGSYLELPLRLAQLRLVTQSLPKHKTSLKPLAWLLGFRISLLAYYGARVLLSELDKELHRAPAEATVTSSTEETGTQNVAVSGPSRSSSYAKCALCIDTLTAPATVPCGHIFCWTCIVGYAASEGGGGAGGGGVVKCPICRTEFPGQRIRALYNYS